MVVAALAFWALMSAQGQPVPQPFPRPAQPGQGSQGSSAPPAPGPRPVAPAVQPVPSPPVQPLPAPENEAAPSEAVLGVPIYPGAQFIRSYDAGRGQRYYLFGSSALFADLVAYYRGVLKQKGELIYDVPATHEFDVGKFNEETMAFPPGVTIKDFQSDVSQGFPNPKASGQPSRFPTIIQIVPATGGR